MGSSVLGVPYRHRVHVGSSVLGYPIAGYMWGVVCYGYPMEQGTCGE